MENIDLAFEEAQKVIAMNVTSLGFTACSIQHDIDDRSNYKSIWTRDSSITLIWTLSLNNPKFLECGKHSILTIFSHQTEDGHLPNYVDIKTNKPEYGGIGNVAGIDGPMWIVMATALYTKHTKDVQFAMDLLPKLKKTMFWLSAHDSNNNGLIEIPEASDWSDLFPRTYNVLYDQALWYRTNILFADLLEILGQHENSQKYVLKAMITKEMVNYLFWPDLNIPEYKEKLFSDVQFSMGRTQYLIAQITPFSFNWRCDVFGNMLSYLYGILDDKQAKQLRLFLQQVGVDKPYPVQVLYPAIYPGDKDWREYFLVNLKNLPHHYHNGGIWPFIGGLWVRFLYKTGEIKEAEKALDTLANLCKDGIDYEWEFNEWAHGITGKPMGKAFQAWSAASFIAAYNLVKKGIDVSY